MAAEECEQHGGPQQQERVPVPRPSAILWEEDLANTAQLMGRVGRDVEIKYLDSGKVAATASLAVHEGSHRAEGPSWFTSEICDDLAEIALHHVAKGKLILVAGQIVVDKRVKGAVRSTIVKVVVRDLRFVEHSSDRWQPLRQSNDEFTVRGSSSQSQAEVASADSSQRNGYYQRLSSQPSQGTAPWSCVNGVKGHGTNIAQLETQSAQPRAGASEWREAARVIDQSRDTAQENGSTQMHSAGTTTEAIAGLRNRVQRGITTDSSRKAHWMDGRSTPSWMKAQLNLIAQGRLQSRANYGSRDWSRETAQGNGTTHLYSAGTTTEAIAGLQNCLQQGSIVDSYTYINVLQMCLKHKDLSAVRQVHECIVDGRMHQNPYVGPTLVSAYIKCGALSDARRVFDELEKKSVITWNNMIAGYARSDNAESALELFKLMRQYARPNEVTYLCILKACVSPLALAWGKQVHECIRHAGFESDVRVGTALLQMYAKCGCIAKARRIFENLTNRNLITWNIMIGAYAESAHGVEAYELFLEMRRQGFEPNAITYLSILNASASAGASEWVKEIHVHARQAGLESDLRVGNALVHMYAESGSIEDAVRVFDRMEKRDVVTWNAMIGGLAQHGCGREAYKLFLQMRHEGFEPNAITYLSILNASASVGALEWVKEVHGHACKAELESDLRVGNALVHMYAESGSVDDARLVFGKMEKRDVVTWNTMIGGLAQHGCGHEAYQLFLQMRLEGFEPDAVTFASILKGFATAVDLGWVKEVHGHASKAGLESDLRVGNALVHMYARSSSIDDARLVFDRMEKRDVVTWNVMIGGLAQHGCGHEAYQLLLQMQREGFEPNEFTFASILNASASGGALGWVKEIHRHVSKAGVESDLRVGNALVHMYAECGSIDDARLVFDRMEKRDVVTWNTMIAGLAQHGRGHEALALFREMILDRVKPDGTSFVAVLSACSHAGLLHDGRRLFLAMTQDYGIDPTVVHYTCMVDLLGRAGHLEEAKRFISGMPIEPNRVTWTTLLGACRTYGNVELGKLAADELFKLEPSRASTYVLLSNIYAAAGKWEEVSVVRTMMQKRGVRKEPGRSWIEVDNKIHEFVVGDTSHPEAKAIYTELNKLTEQLKAEGYIPDTGLVLHDIEEEDKELALCSHSEKLAIVYGLMHIPRGEAIRLRKNLRVCPDCHTATKLISKVTGREIIARDASRFHRFKDGVCSCGDYW